MEKAFKRPDFSKKDVELRYENGVVCIYGTAKGLEKIVDLCNDLIKNPSEGHVHLEDCQILTKASEKGAIAIFEK